ncbi:hypothetical protein PENTCL1PPCAC_14126, partial [Pristionchus entomophagus]
IYQDSPTVSSRSSSNPIEFQPGDHLDPLDTKRIQTIRDGINTIANPTSFSEERRKQLKDAVYAVCVGELTFTAASIKFEIHYATVREYVTRVRVHLGSILPPQDKEKEKEKEEKKKEKEKEKERGQTIRDAVNSVVKPRQRNKMPLRKALYAVCNGEMTVNEASKKYNAHLPILHYCMKKALGILEHSLPEEVKKDERRTIGYVKNTQEEETVTIDESELSLTY